MAHRTKPWRLTIAATIVVTVAYGAWTLSRQPGSPTPRTATSTIAGIPAGAVVVDTRHYRIHSSASPKDATEIGQALEALYTAYGDLFPIANDPGRLPLILYRDRAEFSRNNRSSHWAEAYYLDPACYAYFDAAAPNPHHWAMHEAVLQLARKASRFPRNRWIDEGLASYFSASRRVDGRLQSGNIDPTAYPAWWLADAAGKRDMPIRLEVLLSGSGGPDVNTHFNQYYLSAWSLTHFLLHRHSGRHVGAYRAFLEAGADRNAFLRHIGTIETIESEWIPYFRRQVEASIKASP